MACLGDFGAVAGLLGRLRPIGLGETAAEAKAELLAASAAVLRGREVAPKREAAAFLVPGRIEVLGKHTDYCGGRTMVMAVDRGFCLVAAGREDDRVRVIAAQTGEQAEFSLDGDITPVLGDWSNYPMTVARRLVRNFGEGLRGADIAFASDLPPAAGMSSSSALMIAIYLGLAKVNGLAERHEYRENINNNEELAGYLATIENGQNFGSLTGDKGVGTFGGSEDHTAILCGATGKLSQYSYCPLRFERAIAAPEGYVWVVGSSGVIAAKTGAAMEKYNQASRKAAAVAQQWRDATGRDDPHMAAAVRSGPEAIDQMRQVLRESNGSQFNSTELIGRFEHFVAESEQIVAQAGDALAAGDIGTFGRMVDLSQALTESLLGNQVPETVFLAKSARDLGAVAASAFGAGFGGSIWALVAEEAAGELVLAWQREYAQAYPEPADRARFFVTQAGPAASELR